MIELFWLSVAWLCYFFIHSLLASLTVKQRIEVLWPGIIPAYRLGYNLLAVALLIPILWWTIDHPGLIAWVRVSPMNWIADGLALLAIAGFLWSTRYYDGSEFIGTRQLFGQRTSAADQESLCISPLHRFVRHPWYSFALVIIWTREMSSAWLVACVMMTAYFVIGSRLEERKLVVYFGATYQEYMHKVPGLVPLPWRYLSAEDARRIESL